MFLKMAVVSKLKGVSYIKIKKLISLLLVLVMLATVCGCHADVGESSSQPPTDSTPSSEANIWNEAGVCGEGERQIQYNLSTMPNLYVGETFTAHFAHAPYHRDCAEIEYIIADETIAKVVETSDNPNWKNTTCTFEGLKVGTTTLTAHITSNEGEASWEITIKVLEAESE